MTPKPLARGVWPVMLTPFHEDRSIDSAALEALTEAYIHAGVAGLFACAQSAEMFQLTNDEKLFLARRILRCARGRVPVIAAAFAGGSLDEQITFVRRMADTGVEAVVVTACQLAPAHADEQEWRFRAERLIEGTRDIPLGLYEMPVPYHRLLSPKLMSWLSSTGRVLFHKDTSGDASVIQQKIAAVRGTPLGFFNADTPTLLDSLRQGADGFSGIGANFMPHLYVWLCGPEARRYPDEAERLQAFLGEHDAGMHRKYPASAKLFLRMRGLEMRLVCRAVDEPFTASDRRWLMRFLEASKRVSSELGVADSLAAAS